LTFVLSDSDASSPLSEVPLDSSPGFSLAHIVLQRPLSQVSLADVLEGQRRPTTPTPAVAKETPAPAATSLAAPREAVTVIVVAVDPGDGAGSGVQVVPMAPKMHHSPVGSAWFSGSFRTYAYDQDMGSRFVIRPTTFIDRTISWCDSISDELISSGPMVFTHDRLVRQQHLFAHRAALVYTPTENIPEAGIGIGSLDVTLPIVTPDFDVDGRAYVKPGFWVDLLQRHTGKLRWRPISRAHVTFVRYDCYARDLGSCASDSLGTRPVVDEGVKSCPRAGCGKSACPVR
jgi:hypothetical protein